jgi:hypothetical protein
MNRVEIWPLLMLGAKICGKQYGRGDLYLNPFGNTHKEFTAKLWLFMHGFFIGGGEGATPLGTSCVSNGGQRVIKK